MRKVIGNPCKILYVLVVVLLCCILSSCKNEEYSLSDQIFSHSFNTSNNYDDVEIFSLEKYTYVEYVNDGVYSYENQWCLYCINYINSLTNVDYEMLYTYKNDSLYDISSLKNIDLWKDDFPKTYELYTKMIQEEKYTEYKKYTKEEWKKLFTLSA